MPQGNMQKKKESKQHRDVYGNIIHNSGKMGRDPLPKLGKGYINYGTLRQWNAMLRLKEIKFTDPVGTSKCTVR